MSTEELSSGEAGPAERVTLRFVLVRCLPLFPSIILFGMAIGVLASGKLFSVAEAVLFSGSVFAGASQIAALEAWTDPPRLLTLAAIVAAVNSRYFLVGATLAPVLAKLPFGRQMTALFLTVDPNWAMGMAMKASREERSKFLIVSGLLLMSTWLASTAVGCVLGTAVGDPRTYGVDLMVIIYFASLLPSMWTGGRQIAAWATALVVALAVWHLFGGHWHIIAGGISGSLVAAVYGDDRKVEPHAH